MLLKAAQEQELKMECGEKFITQLKLQKLFYVGRRQFPELDFVQGSAFVTWSLWERPHDLSRVQVTVTFALMPQDRRFRIAAPDKVLLQYGYG